MKEEEYEELVWLLIEQVVYEAAVVDAKAKEELRVIIGCVPNSISKVEQV